MSDREATEFFGLPVITNEHVPEGVIGVLHFGRGGKSALLQKLAGDQPSIEIRSTELKDDRAAIEAVWPWIKREFDV